MRFTEYITLRYFPDTMSIETILYIIVELARCNSPLTPSQKKKLLGHITFLVKETHSLIYQYILDETTLDWATAYFQQIEYFLQDRKKWILAPRDSTLDNLQQDFYRLAIMYISGNLGEFEFEIEVTPKNSKPNTNILNTLKDIPRVAIGVLLPIVGLIIVYLRRDLVANFLDVKVFALICVGWLLLAIDVLLKLGIVSNVVGIAKSIKALT